MLFQCPKLTPLQSRFVASFAALALLGLVYWSWSNPHFAYAAELDLDGSGQSRGGEDHNWHRIQQRRLEDDGVEEDEDGASRTDAGLLGARAVTPQAISGNDAPNTLNILPGNTTLWEYPNALLVSSKAVTGPGLPSALDLDRKREVEPGHAELRSREDSTEKNTIFVSINTCLQPTWNGTGVQTAAPPQLTLYVSTESGNTDLGPNGQSQIVRPLQEGFANVSLTANGDWYMSVYAPALPEGFVGSWNYELAVSINAFYHAADPTDPFLYLVDADNDSALLVTGNLTQADASSPLYTEWMNTSSPFIMFAANINHTSTMGVMNSFCGWSQANPITGNQEDLAGTSSNVEMGMITRGLGNKPKQQFFLRELNGSSRYNGVLAMVGNSTDSGVGVVGGGGKVWQGVNWTTKADGNCALLFNLTFCTEVAYAVPSNPGTTNITTLRQIFDNYTSVNYQQFNYSLQQIPCNTTSDAQYSLAKNCDYCAKAYKEWLCAVSIPRCEDFTNQAPYLQPRNMGQVSFTNGSIMSPEYLNQQYVPMAGAPSLPGSPKMEQTWLSSLATNSSRNPMIDATIQPGPYKELLPCEDLCYSLVQSCPASFGFGCPYPGRGLEAGYGKRNGTLHCNYLGAVYDTSDGDRLSAPLFKAVVLAGLAALVVGLA
ncbi:hypothetical protein LTR36_000133 [Oleoguttula mirabilis]|uniref:Uncharacterized protein n=1 Tax=Oleoguttula mirabilis TaxID=1507867 RepID=A0AAV9JY25_9PEZI|nr:hypothetical protein LTR36_000133 [Oleoguttula mirabilis]